MSMISKFVRVNGVLGVCIYEDNLKTEILYDNISLPLKNNDVVEVLGDCVVYNRLSYSNIKNNPSNSRDMLEVIDNGGCTNILTGRFKFYLQETYQVVPGPPSRFLKIIEGLGYELKVDGYNNPFWYCGENKCLYGLTSIIFGYKMVDCGKKLSETKYIWPKDFTEDSITYTPQVLDIWTIPVPEMEVYYQQKIVDLMTFKASISHNAYFYQRDLDNIHYWPLEVARMVYEKIKGHSRSDFPFSSEYCPFCIAFNHQCEKCPYAKTHGICGDSDSDYSIYIWENNTIENRSKMQKFLEDW